MNKLAHNLTNALTAAQMRALYVCCVGCFPVVLAGVLSMAVFGSGAVAMDDGIGHTNAFARFDYPLPGSRVNGSFTVKGDLLSVPEGKTVYLVETVNKRSWPKQLIGTSSTEFSREQHVSAGSGYKYTVELVAVDESGKSLITDWFHAGTKTGKYPGIASISGAEVLSRVRVVRR